MPHDITAEEFAAMKQGGFDLEMRAEDDPFLDTARELTALAQSCLSLEAAAQRLGVPLIEVQRLIDERALYAFKGETSWVIPDFQFESNRLVPGIQVVNPHLPADLPPISIYRWYSQPNAELELDGQSCTPLEWLAKDQPADAVIESAIDL